METPVDDLIMAIENGNTATTLCKDNAQSKITDIIHNDIVVRPNLDVKEFTICFQFLPKSD